MVPAKLPRPHLSSTRRQPMSLLKAASWLFNFQCYWSANVHLMCRYQLYIKVVLIL
jgi:hypothetical protein